MRPVPPGRGPAPWAAGGVAGPALVLWRKGRGAGCTACRGRRSKTRRSPTVEKTRFLWPMPPAVPEGIDGFEHVVGLWAGSPMPADTTRRTARRVRGQNHLGDDLSAPSWRRRPSLPVMQNRQPTAGRPGSRRTGPSQGQEHAFHGLAVAQSRPAGRKTRLRRVFGTGGPIPPARPADRAGRRVQPGAKVLSPAAPVVEGNRQAPGPAARGRRGRAWRRGGEALAELFDSRMGGRMLAPARRRR